MEQNYGNHSRYVTGYHKVLFVLLLAGLIGSGVNIYESLYTSNIYSASLITLLFVCSAIIFAYVRLFPLKAQDRAIRAEENFRHYVLTGKLLSTDLRMEQIIALRFAPDEELPGLALRASNEKLKPKEIKKAIINWKSDYNRV